jgi:chromosome segregation ATPase
LQEAFAQTVQDSHSLNIEHERVRMQLRKNIDEEHMKLSVAEAALVNWQQRHEGTSSMLQAEQQLRQREHQAAAADRQRLSNEVWRLEAADAQLKTELAAATKRCEELALGAEKERSAAERRIFELNSSHSAEISQIKKALAEVQTERVNAQRDVEALQERLQQLQKDFNFEKGISVAAMESLQSNVDMLQKQLQVQTHQLQLVQSYHYHHLDTQIQVAQESASAAVSRMRDEHNKRCDALSSRSRSSIVHTRIVLFHPHPHFRDLEAQLEQSAREMDNAHAKIAQMKAAEATFSRQIQEQRAAGEVASNDAVSVVSDKLRESQQQVCVRWTHFMSRVTPCSGQDP